MNALGKSALSWLAVLVFSGLIVAATVVGWGLLAYGSIHALPALARGQVVLAQPESIALGDLQVGRRYEVALTLTNLRSVPVRVNGMSADCTCVSSRDWPLEIPPRGRRHVQLWVQPREFQAGKPISQSAAFYLSVPGPPVSISMQGSVAHPNSVAMSP